MLSIVVSSFALSPGAPKLGEHRVTARAAASRAAFSLGPALTVAALPAHAEPLQALAALDSQQVILPTTLLAEDGGIFGIVATVIVAGLGLFVLNFIKDAAFEVGSQVEERGDRIRQATDGDSAKSKKGSFTYDDSGTGANNALPEEGLLKKSKQMKSDGTRYAPWMVIDEDGVEARKKERLDRIKKEKKKGLFGN